MVGLTDIAPSTRTVRVGGEDVAVYGVSAKGIAQLLGQFPKLGELMTGGKLDNVDAASMLKLAPEAIAAVIAAGCGAPGDPNAVAVAERLPVAAQGALLDAIIDLTMPEGVGPFVDALTATMAKLNFDAHGKVPASNSQSPSKS